MIAAVAIFAAVTVAAVAAVVAAVVAAAVAAVNVVVAVVAQRPQHPVHPELCKNAGNRTTETKRSGGMDVLKAHFSKDRRKKVSEKVLE